MNKDLTVGKPGEVLVRFSIPMFMSVIFQQLYNMADSVVAGRFAGEDALASVGASYPITMLFMAVAIGSNIGCTVIISQLFGAKRPKDMKSAISTSIFSCVALSIILTVLGLVETNNIMRLIQTPDNIFKDGALYLRIYVAGFSFVYLYNIFNGIFTSLGDSKTPLYFLIGSSLSNIVLDLIFVAVFHWGVAGVAWATFIAQGIACVLSGITVFKRIASVKTDGPYKKFSGKMLKRLAMVAIPSILQQSFVSVGGVLIQGLVNSFGSAVIAGYSAAIKLNTFVIMSISTIGNGVSSFTAQNMGAGKSDRVKEGYKAGIIMGVLIAIAFTLLYVVKSEIPMGIFMQDKTGDAMHAGVQFLHIVAPFYIVISVKLIADGVLRGAGCMREFMVSTFADLIVRVILAFILAPIFAATGIWLSWPLGWAIGAILTTVFYLKGRWKNVAYMM